MLLGLLAVYVGMLELPGTYAGGVLMLELAAGYVTAALELLGMYAGAEEACVAKVVVLLPGPYAGGVYWFGAV